MFNENFRLTQAFLLKIWGFNNYSLDFSIQQLLSWLRRRWIYVNKRIWNSQTTFGKFKVVLLVNGPPLFLGRSYRFFFDIYIYIYIFFFFGFFFLILFVKIKLVSCELAVRNFFFFFFLRNELNGHFFFFFCGETK